MENYEHLKWKEISREKIKDCVIFDYYKARRVAPNGMEMDVTLLDSPDSVTIISIVKNEDGVDCFLMVRQFRHGNEEVVLEFPAGLVDAGEKPKDAAMREFSEETGYVGKSAIELGKVCPNPAYLNNLNYTYFIEEPVYKGLEHFDSGEVLDLVKVPIKEAHEKIGEGELSNGMMMISYLFYLKWKANQS